MPAFAKRLDYMSGSAAIIRGLFGAMNDPETISFGGGAPASDALPVEQIRAIAGDILSRDTRGVEALQYGPVQGLRQLREIIASQLLAPKGVSASAEDILIVNGGLETMNLLCQVFLNPGDVILCESPTFVHCVEIFEMFEAKCIGCKTDADGLVMEDVEKKILQYRPKFVYTIPTFQTIWGVHYLARSKENALGKSYLISAYLYSTDVRVGLQI